MDMTPEEKDNFLSGIFGNSFYIPLIQLFLIAILINTSSIGLIGVVVLIMFSLVKNGNKNNSKLKEIPVIITSQLGADYETKALAMGAADFIAKPYHPQIAMRRVANVMADSRLRMLKREKELLEKVEKMERLAQRDILTGLYNRRELELKVNKYFCEKKDGCGAFVIMDIDNFKLINDSLGHIKGDQALCKVAEILRSCFRQEDIISRMGGDEFAVFIPSNISVLDIRRRMEILCERMEFTFEDIQISCSIGICIAPEFGEDYQSLYSNADTALLSAKRFGKNQYQIFGNDIEMPSLMLFRNMDWLLDEASDAIFVCDADNYDLYYLNNVACGMGNKQQKECVGRQCYEVLWGRTKPCTYCNQLDTEEHRFCECEINPDGTNDYYIVKRKMMDWNGKKARIEYIQESTACAMQRQMVQQELNHEQALVACVDHLLGLEDMDEALNHMLETIGNYYQGERVFILTEDPQTGRLMETHSWKKEGCEGQVEALSFDFEKDSIWRAVFCHKKTINISDIQALETSSRKEYECLKKAGIYNGYVKCFDMNSQNRSCICIYNRKVNQQDVALLENVVYFVNSEMSKRLRMKQHEQEKISSLSNKKKGSCLKVKNDQE